MLTDAEEKRIKDKVEGSFKPLRCVAEIYDYKQKLRFKVFDANNNGIVEVPEFVMRDFDERKLDSLLAEVREKVKAKGFSLE